MTAPARLWKTRRFVRGSREDARSASAAAGLRQGLTRNRRRQATREVPRFGQKPVRPFPLTPALSLGERGNRRPSLGGPLRPWDWLAGYKSGRGPCTLHASRCSLAAASFPSPPLEERGRERRSSFSASTPEILVRQSAGRSPRTAASRIVRGLLSPTSSKGGEGEPLAHCSRPPDACNVQRDLPRSKTLARHSAGFVLTRSASLIALRPLHPLSTRGRRWRSWEGVAPPAAGRSS